MTKRERLVVIEGYPSDPAARPPGCAFAPRCLLVVDRCRNERPPLEALLPGRFVACFRADYLRTLESTK